MAGGEVNPEVDLGHGSTIGQLKSLSCYACPALYVAVRTLIRELRVNAFCAIAADECFIGRWS